MDGRVGRTEHRGSARSLLMKVWRRILPPLFRTLERMGLHVVAADYYSPIPRRAERVAAASSESALIGIEISLQCHETFLRTLLPPYVPEFTSLCGSMGPFRFPNPSFREVDAEAYYSVLRSLRPKRVVEIGSGYSSLLAAFALRQNSLVEGSDGSGRLEVVDPYPFNLLSTLENVDVHEKPVQEMSLDFFTSLNAGDILFIDSSHVLRSGSDVTFELLEILPRLGRGVFVHFHDVFLPGGYPAEWLEKKSWFWNEQQALQAFLSFNDAFEILWAGSWLAHHHPDVLSAAIPSFGPGVRPGSLWIRRIVG